LKKLKVDEKDIEQLVSMRIVVPVFKEIQWRRTQKVRRRTVLKILKETTKAKQLPIVVIITTRGCLSVLATKAGKGNDSLGNTEGAFGYTKSIGYSLKKKFLIPATITAILI
jgi:hypothetical protein